MSPILSNYVIFYNVNFYFYDVSSTTETSLLKVLIELQFTQLAMRANCARVLAREVTLAPAGGCRANNVR